MPIIMQNSLGEESSGMLGNFSIPDEVFESKSKDSPPSDPENNQSKGELLFSNSEMIHVKILEAPRIHKKVAGF